MDDTFLTDWLTDVLNLTNNAVDRVAANVLADERYLIGRYLLKRVP